MSKTADEISAIAQGMAEDDDNFSTRGNAAAGTRTRKALQEIIAICKNRRVEIQAAKNSEKKKAA